VLDVGAERDKRPNILVGAAHDISWMVEKHQCFVVVEDARHRGWIRSQQTSPD
jgi:hypothetical protein